MLYSYSAIREKNRWDAYIYGSRFYEIYHTWFYHSLNREGEPVLFVYEEKDIYVALPLIKRRIDASAFFDMTSVYGYTGPVSNADLEALSSESTLQFKAAFEHFMDAEHAICAFSRLHPFLGQHTLLGSLGGIRENGRTVYIDLKQPLANQRAQYHKVLQKQVRKLRAAAYTIREAGTSLELRNFTQMYNENMDRLQASAAYYFDERYFEGLLNDSRFRNKLLLIYEGRTLMCGALVLISESMIRNHLSATAPAYIRESPSKLLTDEISLVGRALDLEVFHLGGGVGGKDDSLYTFKKSFSDLQLNDRIWCYTHHTHRYQAVVDSYGEHIDLSSNFFPLYRQQLKAVFK